jgi:hypothetical protein
MVIYVFFLNHFLNSNFRGYMLLIMTDLTVPVAAPSKTCIFSNTEFRGFESRDAWMYVPVSFFVALFSVSRGLTMGRSPVQGVLPKCLKRFIVSEVHFESEQARGPNL